MNLETQINTSIWNYPSLYKCENHERSRILVLRTFFMAYGTGYEWHPDGYLDCSIDSRIAKEKLPDDYYSSKYIKVKTNLLERFKELLPELLMEEIVEENEKETFIKCIVNDPEYYKNHLCQVNFDLITSIYNCSAYFGDHNFDEISYPQDLCKYSPLVQMISDKCPVGTAPISYKQDWIDGGLEISRFMLDYYSDQKKLELLKYSSMGNHWQKRINNMLYGQVTKEVIKRAKLSWKNNIKEQVKILKSFEKKFKPKT